MRFSKKATGIALLATVALVWAPSPAGLTGQVPVVADAEAYGVRVQTATTDQTVPHAALGGGYYAEDAAETVSVGGLADAENAFARTTGGGDDLDVSSESSATLEEVSLLDGVITAEVVVAISASAIHGTTADSNTDGSTFTGLVVNGVSIDSGVAPNTRIELPGIGAVVLNEESRSGDGVDSSGIAVNMIHVVLQDPLTGAKTGDIVVGSASSSVSR